MAGQRTRPQNLNFGCDGNPGDSSSNGEAVRMSDIENQGGYRPIHSEGRHSIMLEHDAFVPSSFANPLMRTLYELLEDPTSSSGAFIIHVVTTSLIILSAMITILETLPPFHRTPSKVWFGLETALVVCFTAEYVCRAYAHSQSLAQFWRWFSSFFAIVDLLAIVPYYIEIAVQADTTAFFRFSILRTFRLLRVFRPFKYSSTILLTIEVMYLSMRRSQNALFALFFFALVVLVVFSTLLYFAERGTWDEALETFVDSDGDPSQFSSIPAAGWFILVTITTVGYGEIIPRSFLGRLFTLPLLLFGLLLIALPSFVLGREFASLWEVMSQRGGVRAMRTRVDSISMLIEAHARATTSARSSLVETPAEQETDESNVFRYPPAQSSTSTFTPRIGLEDPTDSRERALSNRRLGRNQQVLSQQIEELGSMLKEMRAEMRIMQERQETTSGLADDA